MIGSSNSVSALSILIYFPVNFNHGRFFYWEKGIAFSIRACLHIPNILNEECERKKSFFF